MKTVNLFGETVDVISKPRGYQSSYQRFRSLNQYRKSDSNQQCKNCKYHHACGYHNKIYHKCELLGISNSEATDIRVSFVCNKWWRYDV